MLDSMNIFMFVFKFIEKCEYIDLKLVNVKECAG